MYVRRDVDEQTGGTALTLFDEGRMVACVEYFWVKNMADLRRADRGERPEGGEVLYVTNIATSRPGSTDLKVLQSYLPPYRYIAGLRLKTPKGVPHGFYHAETPVSVSV